jgi:hypothetical protein
VETQVLFLAQNGMSAEYITHVYVKTKLGQLHPGTSTLLEIIVHFLYIKFI